MRLVHRQRSAAAAR